MKASYNKYMRLQVGNQQAVTAQFTSQGWWWGKWMGISGNAITAWPTTYRSPRFCFFFFSFSFFFKTHCTALTCWVRVQRPKSRGFSVSLPSSLFRYDMETESPSTQASRKLENLQNFTNSFPVKHLQRSKAPRCVLVHGFVRRCAEKQMKQMYSGLTRWVVRAQSCPSGGWQLLEGYGSSWHLCSWAGKIASPD